MVRLRPSVFRPVYTLLFVIFCFFLFSLGLSSQLGTASLEFSVFVVLLVLASFLGLLLGGRFFASGKYVIDFEVLKFDKVSILIAFALVSIATLFFFIEHLVFFLNFGNIPILLPNVEELRFSFQINGYVHLIAYSGLTVLIFLYWVRLLGGLSKGQILFFYFFVFVNLSMSAFIGSRGDFVIFLFSCFLINISLRKVGFFHLFLLFVIGFLFVGISKFLRDYMFSGPDLIRSISEVWAFRERIYTYPLYFSYITFSMSFEMLNQYFNADMSHTLGYFTLFSPVASVFVDVYSLSDLQLDVLGIDFRGVLTASGFSVPFFDFGYFSVIWLFVLFYFFGFMYRMVFYRGRVQFLPVYTYLYVKFIIFSYSYPFIHFFVLAYLVLLFSLCFMMSNKSKMRFGC